jgi:hypothetical protein
MYNNLHSLKYKIINQIFLITIFIIFTIPFSINFGGGGLSANYSFIFLPLLMILLKRKMIIPNNNVILIILFFCLTFFASHLFQFEFYQYLDRRTLSFIIFMSVFSYLFIDITDEMVKAFKISIVIFSCIFSLIKLGEYYSLGGTNLNFTAKTSIGSQRFGFVFLLAFWILVHYKTCFKFKKFLQILCILIILVGIMNTFSRSSILALSFSLIIFSFTNVNLNIKSFTLGKLVNSLKYMVLSLLFGYLTFKVFPVQVEFYLMRIFDFFLEGKFYAEITDSNPKSSLGYRVAITKEIMYFVMHNPFLGSGFLGCWILKLNLNPLIYTSTCSAHSQYADVFFRVGFLGFSIYIYLLYRVLKYLKNSNRDLYFGFITVLIYGFVHETFKLSHGAFILTFLIGMTFNKKLNNFPFLKNKVQNVSKYTVKK